MQLRYSEQANREGKALILHIAGGVILGVGCFAFLVSSFGLNWKFAEVLSGKPLAGLLSVCNSIADHLGSSDYIILKRFAGGYLENGATAPQGMFLTLLMILLVILSWTIIRGGYTWLLLVLAVPAAALMLASDTHPEPVAGLAFAFGLACALAIMLREGTSGSLWTVALPALALLICLGGAAVIGSQGGIPISNLQEKSQAALQEMLDSRYGTNPLGNGRLSLLDGDKLVSERGSMSRAGSLLSKPSETETALQITLEDPEACYLRGYIGEKYTKDRWTILDNRIYYDQRDEVYRLDKRGFDGLSQLSYAANVVTGGSVERRNVSIEVIDADRSCVYVPYEASGLDAGIPEGTANYAGGFLRTQRFLGSKKYEWNVQSGLTARWTDWAGKLYSADTSEEVKAYFENESHFNVWCYEQYTNVPDHITGLLEAAVGDPGDLSRDHVGYKEAISTIRDYLDSNYIYTEDIFETKKGEDPIEKFMLTGKGCDAHFASLASLLFRWYGIPARYVEGYLVTPTDAEHAKATGTVDIGRDRAHAWTEIYIDGLGWVPIEVTSVYRDIMPEADMEKGLEAVSYEKKRNDQQDVTEEELPLDNTEHHYGRLILMILAIAFGILLMIILAIIIYRLIRKRMLAARRQKAFSDPDPRKGICAMYGYLIAENIPRSDRAVEIGNLAAFSRNEVEEYHRSEMRKEMEWGEHEKETLEKLDRRSPADRIIDFWDSLRRK